MNPGFWRQKKVLLTGHTGFKGSWLCLWLQHLGARVAGFSLPPPTSPSLFELAQIGQGMKTWNADVRDLPRLKEAVRAHEPEIIIHLAAQSLVRRSYLEPVETYSTNVLGTVNVLEAARDAGGVRALIVVTSDKCYENHEALHGYREDEPMGGHDPYSSSKACAELVTAAYRKSFFSTASSGMPGTAVASVRAGNVIGGGDWAEDRLIPDLVRAFLKQQPAAIRNPRAVRPWQHVLDPLQGYLMLAQRLCEDGAPFAEAWNFGPDERDEQSVENVAARMVTRWGAGASCQLASGNAPHEAGFLKLDSTKARTRLAWKPRLDLDQAVDWSAEWYRAYGDARDARELTLDQIIRYTAVSAR